MTPDPGGESNQVRLREYQAKSLLAHHGVPIPRGALWPELPDVPPPWVAKAQIPEGGRGRRGGVRVVRDRGESRRVAEQLLGARLGNCVIDRVYFEEYLEIDREMYLALIADREQRAPVVLAAPRGGIDVESAPRESFVRLVIDPLLGLRPFAVRRLVAWLGATGPVADLVSSVVRGLYSAFTQADAEIVEVNPLAITREGRVVALDAKVALDGHAAFRHPERDGRGGEGTPFERACAALGASGVEMDGTIAVIASGAGLLMATVDLLAASGGRLRAAVDLGGTVFGEPDRIAQVVRAVLSLHPRVLLVNAYFQLACCSTLARAVAAALGEVPGAPPAIIRLRGRGLPDARTILAALDVTPVQDLEEACRLAAAADRGSA